MVITQASTSCSFASNIIEHFKIIQFPPLSQLLFSDARLQGDIFCGNLAERLQIGLND